MKDNAVMGASNSRELRRDPLHTQYRQPVPSQWRQSDALAVLDDPPPSYESACAAAEMSHAALRITARQPTLKSEDLSQKVQTQYQRPVQRPAPSRRATQYSRNLTLTCSTGDKLGEWGFSESRFPVFCSDCTVRHEVDPSSPLGIQDRSCRLNDVQVCFGDSICVAWWQARLVMHGYRLGPEFGIPWQSLCYVQDTDLWTHTTLARILENRLLWRITTHNKWPYHELGQRILDLPVCKHLRSSDQLQDLCLRTKETESKVYRCHKCPTEYRISTRALHAIGDKDVCSGRLGLGSDTEHLAFSFELTQWTDLGICLNLDSSPEWKALSNPKMFGYLPSMLYDEMVTTSVASRFEGWKIPGFAVLSDELR